MPSLNLTRKDTQGKGQQQNYAALLRSQTLIRDLLKKLHLDPCFDAASNFLTNLPEHLSYSPEEVLCY